MAINAPMTKAVTAITTRGSCIPGCDVELWGRSLIATKSSDHAAVCRVNGRMRPGFCTAAVIAGRPAEDGRMSSVTFGAAFCLVTGSDPFG
jgi:hypothetical protein